MRLSRRTPGLTPQDWGLDVGPTGELLSGGCNCVELARQFGTPLHVFDEQRLADTAADFLSAFSRTYPGKTSVHYAFKCNPVPAIIDVVKQAGMKAEVMTEFELFLAQKRGFSGNEIVVNGPYKPDCFLRACLAHGVRFVIADSFQELKTLNRIAGLEGKKVPVLLRINPGYTPADMNSGTATGSRRNCSFGLDLKGGEAADVLAMLPTMRHIDFRGFHFHVGSGIRRPQDYRNTIRRLRCLVDAAERLGMGVDALDIGGGFAAPLSREMRTWEMLAYQAFDRLPSPEGGMEGNGFGHFAAVVTEAVGEVFRQQSWPELIVEPGRSIAGPNQILLLSVHQVKDRPGIKKWLTTDGGISTTTMPTFYELHEVFLCNDVHRARRTRVTLNGPGCFAADVIYRNKRMPEVKPGEVLAIMDSGAYFTSWESSFGYPRPAIVAAKDGFARVVRRRETFEEMTARDLPAGADATFHLTPATAGIQTSLP